jgi:hypothetical protein
MQTQAAVVVPQRFRHGGRMNWHGKSRQADAVVPRKGSIANGG